MLFPPASSVAKRPRALVLANSHASRVSGKLPAALAELRAHLDVQICDVPRTQAERVACAKAMQDCDRIIVAGGDGTLHSVLPLLLSANRPLGVLPLGTANDFARSIGLPKDPVAAARHAAGDVTRPVDLGLVNGLPFLNVASVGLAAYVTKLQTRERKRAWRVMSYAVSLAGPPSLTTISGCYHAGWTGGIRRHGASGQRRQWPVSRWRAEFWT